jgi:hypothetical protein
VTPLLVTGPALASGEEPPPAMSTEAFCQAVPEDYEPFTDLQETPFKDVVECLTRAGITKGGPSGRPADQYGPELSVNRDAMATFIAGVIDRADALDTGDRITALPPFDGEVSFSDVGPDNVHRESIDRLAEAGVVRGGAGGSGEDRYSPGVAVNRAQMATFLDSALEYMTGFAYFTDFDYFTDDADVPVHEPQINVVAEEGIAIGDGVDRYSPLAQVRRDQMAGFLVRTLATLEADEDIRPLE